MRFRHAIALIVAILAAAALAAVAAGQEQGSATAQGGASAAPGGRSSGAAAAETASPAESEGTDPRVHPAYGQAETPFTLTFTLRENAGHEGVMATDYRVGLTPPGSGGSCVGAPPAAIESGAAGELAEVRLTPPAGGWCQGTYTATVYLQRGPYCPPPQEGAQPVPCPEFATQELDTGSGAFTVGPPGPPPPLVSVPRLVGLRPRSADRRLRRRHLRFRYTALGGLCAGLRPQGRIIAQRPGPGTRVPRGARVLLQTSCGR